MTYNYNSADLVKPVELTEREEFLLKESKTFPLLADWDQSL